ncbi:MAG: hypothetical protein IJY23_08255 [Clostridia bacterium]|nr:hypothetical protein [Clostridia bacterium]
MKFVKVIIDGKEYYQKIEEKDIIDESEVENKKSKENEPEIIDAEIENAEELSGSEKFKKDTQEFFEKVGNGAKDLGARIVDGAKNLGEKISVGAKDLGAKIKEGTERLFNKDKSIDPDSTEAKLLRLLPYMSKKDAHSVCEKLLANDETLKNLDIATIMPFLDKEDCDAIFVKCVEVNNTNYDLATAIPFVSAKCLSRVVDNYIAGEYPELDIDSLYPFLSDADIKRIFYHIIGN